MPVVDLKVLFDTFLTLKLQLQSKNVATSQMASLFFPSHSGEDLLSIKELNEVLKAQGLGDRNSIQLARYLIEPKNVAQIEYNE